MTHSSWVMKFEPIWTDIFERKQTVCQEIDLTSGRLVIALSLIEKLKLIFWDYIRPIIFCENPKSILMKYWKKRSYKMCIAPVVGVFLFAGLFKIAIACEAGRRWRKVDGRTHRVITWQKRAGLQCHSSTFNNWSFSKGPCIHSNRLNGRVKCITVHFHISRASTLKFFCPLSVSKTHHFNTRPAS